MTELRLGLIGLGALGSRIAARLLRAGISVYTGMGGYYLPGQPEFAEIDTAARAGGASFTAGGNIPGLISDVRLVVIEGGPHGIPWTHADQVNTALLGFLRS